MQGFIILIGLAYAGLILWFISGWVALPCFRVKYSFSEKPGYTFFSVVVPARNEEGVIHQTLQSLNQQTFSNTAFEVLVVDDHSSDNTMDVVDKASAQFPTLKIRPFQAPSVNKQSFVAFKKLAIQKGVEEAKGDWIVTTDADCQPAKKWLVTLYHYIQQYDPYLVSGPVQFAPVKGVFTALQSLEFMILISIGGASLKKGIPSMCNGANLAYKRSVFKAVNGFEGINSIASGDDELLMHKIHKQFPSKVKFLKGQEAMVYTRPLSNLLDFFQQRKRWASKGSHYQNPVLTIIIAFVGLFHLMLTFTFFLPLSWSFIGLTFSFKLIPEFIFLTIVTPFFQFRSWLPIYLPAAMAYPFYVVLVGIFSQIGGYSWKDRKVR